MIKSKIVLSNLETPWENELHSTLIGRKLGDTLETNKKKKSGRQKTHTLTHKHTNTHIVWRALSFTEENYKR